MEKLSCQYLFLTLMLTFTISASIVKILIPRITLLAFKKKIFDKVDNRKAHKAPNIPRLGGISFFPAFLISISTSIIILSYFCRISTLTLVKEVNVAIIVLSTFTIYLLGIVDDITGVRYRNKFIVQAMISLLLIASGIYINNFYGFLGLYELPLWFAMPFSLIIYLLIQNAMNLIDGIDGLASGLSIIALSGFTAIFLSMKMYIYAIMTTALIGALCTFFYHNVFGRIGNKNNTHRKIFMGDTGSLTIGLLLGVFVVKISMYDSSIDYSHLPSNIVYAFSFLIVPTFDVVRVFSTRIKNGKNPFLPDKTHIHHKIISLGFSHHKTLVIILLMSLSLSLFSIAISYYVSINWVLVIVIGVWTLINYIINSRIPKNK